MVEVGQIHGCWQILEDLGYGQKFKCICTACQETVKHIRSHDLTSGRSRMCKGCSSSSEGLTHKDIPEYNSWMSMIQRCTNPNSKDYKHYGARGISVCDLWRGSFDAFYLSLGSRPTPDCTLERLDYNRGYEPGNVTWAPRREQPKNQRSNIRITIGEDAKLVSEWPDDPRCSVSQFTIYKRLKRGWPEEASVLAPSGTKLKDWT